MDNPLDIIFQTMSSMTGGLITDVTTAISALIVIGFIALGIEILTDVLKEKRMTSCYSDDRLDQLDKEREGVQGWRRDYMDRQMNDLISRKIKKGRCK